MRFPHAAFLAHDRLHALVTGVDLPQQDDGTALIADVSGFTPVTERLRAALGARRGAEELAARLNHVYDALIAEVDRHGGAIIGFAGDAITCWFSGEASATRATACGGAMLGAMQDVERVELPEGDPLLLGLKVALASGTTQRFIVGDPDIQLIDILAGSVVARMAAGEELAERGELLADSATVERLGSPAQIREWRGDDTGRFAVLETYSITVKPLPVNPSYDEALTGEMLRQWMLPALADQLQAGQDAFLIELRPVTALFLRFSGIDYDADPRAREKLDRLIRLAQRIVVGYEGNLIQLTIGDKGSYLYAAFGAPIAHEDDPARALNAAIDLQEQLQPDLVQIGISRGIMRTGAYGGATRRTYGALGDEVNLAARLMMRAEPGTILVSDSVPDSRLDAFAFEQLPAITVKGKSQSIGVYRLAGRRERSFEERFYTTPLVGRSDLLEQVQQALQPIFNGQHAGVITIYGEAGMGKSRLAFETQQSLLRKAPVTWLIGQADELNRSALSAFAYFLRPYFGQRREQDTTANLASFDTTFNALIAAADEANRADLLAYRSFLAAVLGLVIPGSAYETADEQLRIDNSLNALKAWARAEAVHQPLVIQLEDAHWLDPISIRAVQQLTYNMENLPLALVLTSRYGDDGTKPTIPDIFSVPVQEFDLNRLSDEGIRVVIGAVLNGEISSRLTRFVGERAEGNPFFTEQLALDLKERDVLRESGSEWDLKEGAAAEVPSNVNAVLIARLDRLTAQVKVVVQTASVLGREFDIEILSRMLRDAEMSAVQEAEREAIWSALDEIRYLFRHALLRDAAYAMQAQERLKALHLLAAETIEVLHPDDETQYDALLEHWQNAQVADKVLRYTVPVCQRLISITADYARAERFLRNALTLDSSDQRATLLRLLGDATEPRADYTAAIGYYEASLGAAVDVSQRILALDSLASVNLSLGENAKTIEQSSRALELAREHQDQLGTARALNTLGEAYYAQADKSTAMTYFEESLSIYRALALEDGILTNLNSMAKIAMDRSENAVARAYLEECLALAQQRGERRRIANMLGNLGNLSMNLGDLATTRSYYVQAMAVSREIGDRKGIALRLGNMSIVEIRQGNLAAAQENAEISLRERRAIGDRRGMAHVLGLLGTIVKRQTDYESARRYYEEALEIQRAINDLFHSGDTLLNLSSLLINLGDYAAAESYGQQGLALYRDIQQPRGIASSLSAISDIAIAQKDLEKARQYTLQALEIHHQIENRDGVGYDLSQLALINMETGALEDAARQMEEALVIMREEEDPAVPWGLAILADIRNRQGHSVETITPLLRESLSGVLASQQARTKQSTLVAAFPLLFAGQHYVRLSEGIGMLLEQKISQPERDTLTTLLDNAQSRLDAAQMEAALERGRSLDLNIFIEGWLKELN